MDHTNIQTIEANINRSQLLTEDRKRQLLKMLPSMSLDHQGLLQEILNEEGEFLEVFADRTVASVVERGDAKTLKKFNSFLAKKGKKLRKVEEGVERTQEVENIEHFFEDTNI